MPLGASLAGRCEANSDKSVCDHVAEDVSIQDGLGVAGRWDLAVPSPVHSRGRTDAVLVEHHRGCRLQHVLKVVEDRPFRLDG